jgi:hypothetical protein
VAVVAAGELVQVAEGQAAAKAPAVAREVAAAGEEPVSEAQAVPAAELASAVREDPATAALEVEVVDPAREEVLAAAGAVLEARAAAQVVEDPAVVDLAAVAPVVAQGPVEVRVDLVEQALAVAARLGAEVQQLNLANGSRPRRLSAAESWVEFPAFRECPVQQALEG